MAEEKTPKKICVPTTSTSDDHPTIPPSPPRFVSLEELMSAAKGMTQMSLAHEIVINKDFKLEPHQPKNHLEKIVKETMHKAFWDVLNMELNADPPCYTKALVLLEEIKSDLLDLLLPQHSRLRAKIDEVLDLDLIKQQAEQGILRDQYLGYASFVISVMAKLCAPIRDEKIAELTQMKDIVPLFSGILDTLTIMKVDMANFTIDVMRPTIMTNSVTYEQEKFREFLKVHPDGLKRTRAWLKTHLSVVADNTSEISKRIDLVLNHAYLDLVQWEPAVDLPETFTMDEARIKEYTKELNSLIQTGTVLLVAFSHAGPNLATIAEWKKKVKDEVLTLVKEGTEALTIGTKILEEIRDAADKYQATGHTLNPDAFVGVFEPSHRVYSLLKTRLLEFLLSAIESNTADRLRIPPGLSILQEEITQLTGRFLRLVSYNRQVFNQHYVDIITELIKEADAEVSS